jgi:hypothetical protein
LYGGIEMRPRPAVGEEGERDERRAINEDDEDDLGIDRGAEHEQRHGDLDDAGDQHDQRELHQRIDRVLPTRFRLLDLGRVVLDEEADGLLQEPREERRPGDEVEVLRAHHGHVVDHAAQRLAEPEKHAIADEAPDDGLAPGAGLHRVDEPREQIRAGNAGNGRAEHDDGDEQQQALRLLPVAAIDVPSGARISAQLASSAGSSSGEPPRRKSVLAGSGPGAGGGGHCHR